MATYYTLSAGRIDVSGDIVLDPSGSHTATLNAVNVTVSTLNSTSVNATNFGFSNLDLSGNLSVDGSANFLGAVNASGTFNVVGDSTLTDLTVNGNTDMSGNLAVGGILSVDLSANFLGPVNASGTFNVVGDSTLTDLIVNGNTDMSGNLAVGGFLSVDGSANFLGDFNSSGTFNVTGINTYEGNVQSGDIISHNLLGYLTPLQTNNYMKGLLGDASGTYWQDTSYNIVIYEMVYWANDFLTNSIDKFSATVLVPVQGPTPFSPTGVPNNTAIVSYKHGTLSTTFQNATLWAAMYAATQGATAANNIPVDPAGWMFASTGYVVVCADNVSYGKSIGAYDYQNVSNEATSQYAAIVATTQFMTLSPTSFYNQFTAYDTVTPLPVINSGYSLGGIQSVFVSQLIANNDPANPYNSNNPLTRNPNTKALSLIQTIAGAPINGYGLLNNVLQGNYNSPTLWSIMFLILLSLGNPSNHGIKNSIRPNILSDVYPVLNQFYLDTSFNLTTQFPRFEYATLGSAVSAFLSQNDFAGPQSIYPPFDGSGYLQLSTFNPIEYFNFTGYVTPNQFYYNPYYADCSATNFALNTAKEPVFYTNNYTDFTPLTGSPITVIYSTGDELCCNDTSASKVYDPSGGQSIFIGKPGATDLVYDTYKNWVDSSNVLVAPNGIWTQGKTFVDVSGGLVASGYTLDTSANPIVGNLLQYESTNTASSIRVNNDGGPSGPAEDPLLQHNTFLLTTFQNGVRNYLLKRP